MKFMEVRDFMRHVKLALLYFVFSILGCSILLSGCKKEPRLKGLVPVKGTVTLDGSPVEGAHIALSPKSSGGEARSAGAMSDKDGHFIVRTLNPDDGAFPGEYAITVTKKIPDQEYTQQERDEAAAKSMNLYYTFTSVLPKKYENKSTSGLTVTVEKNMAPLELKLVN